MNGTPFNLVFVIQDLRMGGAERHAATLLRQLAARGHQVAVVCVEAGGPLVEGLADAGVAVIRLELGDGWKWRMRTARDRVARTLAELDPDAVMTSGYSAEVLTRLVLRGRGDIPVLAWKHNIGHQGRFGVRDRVTEHLLGRWVSRYIAVSYTELGYLCGYLRLNPARISVLRNAVAVPEPVSPAHRASARSELDVGADVVVFGCVAVLRVEKDHATLLRAFAALPALPTAVLVLVGDGPLRDELVELAQRIGVGDRVRFVGSRDDVPKLLAAFDIAVLASRTIENLPYSLLEAMAAGLPVVSTAVGALAELVDHGETGFLVPPGSAAVLAERMGQLVDDERARARIGKAARERVHKGFALERFVLAAEEEVREVVRGGEYGDE